MNASDTRNGSLAAGPDAIQSQDASGNLPGAYSRDADPIDIRWLLRSMYAGRHLMMGSMALALLLAIAYLLVATPRFEATSQLLVESKHPQIFTTGEVTPGLDTSRFMIGQVIDSQIELLRSPRLADRVIRHLNLQGPSDKRNFLQQWLSPRPKAALINQVASNDPTEQDNAAAREDSALTPDMADQVGPEAAKPQRITQRQIDTFLRDLDVRRVGLSLIIQVKYVHKDRAMAAKIANAVAELYVDDQEQLRVNKTKSVRIWLKERVAELQEQIGSSRRKIELYKAEHDLFDTGGQLVKERELNDTISQSITAQANAAALLAQLRKVESSSSNDSPLQATGLALKSNVIADYKRQFAQVQRQLATTISKFGSAHPQVHSFRAELKNLENEISREVARLVENLRNEYEVAKTRADLLNDRVEELKKELSSSRRLKIELGKMERSAKIDTDLHDSLLARLRETELRQSLSQPDTSIVRFAKPPDKPTRPQKALVLVAALMSALVMSVSYTLLSEFFRSILRNPEEARRLLKIPKVVAIPLVKLPKSLRGRRARNEAPLDRLLADSQSVFVQQLFVIDDLLQKVRSRNGRHVIGIVSTSRDDGKSFLSLSLAKYAASSGRRTLLVDGDMQTATLSQQLAPDAQHHLHELLLGETMSADDVVREIEPRLELCPATRPVNVGRTMDILATPRASEFFRSAGEAYDIVIVDTPSMQEFVDTRTIVKHCDLLVFVAVSDRTSGDKANEMLATIADARDRVGILVMNKFKESPFTKLT